MAQNTLTRKLGELDYSSGQITELELPRSHYYQRLNLVVDYDVDVNTVDSGQVGNGILELVDRLEVTLNGNQTLKSTSFALSHIIDHYQYGTEPYHDSLDLSSATNQTGRIQTFVDFTIAPGDLSAMLPSFRLSDLVLEVKWGSDSDIAGDVTVNSATMKVESTERLRKSVATSQTREGEVLDSLMAFKEREKRQSIGSTGETVVELPRGNVYYAIPFQIHDSGSPSESLVSGVEVAEDGVELHRSTDFDLLRATDKQQYNLEALAPGFAYVNFGLRGNLTDVVASQTLDQFDLTVDTDGTAPTDPAEVRMVTQEIIR